MTDDKSVTHVEGDNQFAPHRSSHGTFAKHLHLEVNVVVGGINLLCDMGSLATYAADGLQDHTVNDHVVVLCVCLRYDHVGDISLHSIACEETS